MADVFKSVEYSVQQKLHKLSPKLVKPTIYRVPEPIRNVKKECYEPAVVSIGPIYHNKESLGPLQELKLSHLQCFLNHSLEQLGPLAPSFTQYIECIGAWEQEVRAHYSEDIKIPRHDFIEMIMVDATFIISLFMWADPRIPLTEVPIKEKYEMLHHIQHDIFLAENQLPFFLLNGLYEKAFGPIYRHVPFKDLTINFIKVCHVFDKNISPEVEQKLRDATDIKHLVDVLRIWCLPAQALPVTIKLQKQVKQNNESFNYPPTAKELKAAGVKFSTTETKNLLDISFSGGVLEIPKLRIRDNTETIFRNIVIFEYCHHFSSLCFLHYLIFLDNMINTAEDVRVLAKSGVIYNCLGSEEEVAIIINNMVKHFMINNKFFYLEISQKLNVYVSKKWNRWRAILMRDYFSHPWSIIGVIYALALLILTVLQVVSD